LELAGKRAKAPGRARAAARKIENSLAEANLWLEMSGAKSAWRGTSTAKLDN